MLHAILDNIYHHINGKTTKAVLQSTHALFNDLQLYSNSHCYEISRYMCYQQQAIDGKGKINTIRIRQV